jgi:hypothetical protein
VTHKGKTGLYDPTHSNHSAFIYLLVNCDIYNEFTMIELFTFNLKLKVL